MRIIPVILIVLAVPALAHAATLIVPSQYPTIQTAVDASKIGDTVLVLPGTYVENVDLRGFIVTVKSDQGPEVTVIDGNQTGSAVVCLNKEGPTTVLEGFTLTNGLGTWDATGYHGAGMYNLNSSPTVIGCVFTQNVAIYGDGGGMYNHFSSPTVTGCTFYNNWGSAGGGMCNWTSSSPVITDCTFSENAAFFDGGGMYNYSGSPVLANCAFIMNLAFSRGAGLFVSGGAPTVENCTFYGGAAFSSGGGLHLSSGNPTLINSILWNDTPDEIYTDGSVPAVSYSCVQDGYPGTGNIQQDPLFVDPDQGDLHLTVLSPCINRGIGAGFMGTIDMGAYEYAETHLLEADLFSLSESTGGTVELSLHVGAGNGNRQYILFGGITGTAPGIPLPGGSAILPVNWDLFTSLVIGFLNTPSFSNFAGILNASGEAAATLDSKGPLPPGAVGIIMRFAFGLNQPWNLTSNPVGIEVVP